MDLVPPTVAVKRNRAHNVESPRLVVRRNHLLGQMATGVFDSRMDFAVRAYELQAIENVLVSRDLLSDVGRRTSPGNGMVSV